MVRAVLGLGAELFNSQTKYMKQTPKIYRQGDVLLVPVASTPESATSANQSNGRFILAQGEATGHHHSVLASDAVDLLQIPSQEEMFLLVKEGDALLEHQEHALIQVPPGAYRVVIQKEYDPTGERRVKD